MCLEMDSSKGLVIPDEIHRRQAKKNKVQLNSIITVCKGKNFFGQIFPIVYIVVPADNCIKLKNF